MCKRGNELWQRSKDWWRGFWPSCREFCKKIRKYTIFGIFTTILEFALDGLLPYFMKIESQLHWLRATIMGIIMGMAFGGGFYIIEKRKEQLRKIAILKLLAIILIPISILVLLAVSRTQDINLQLSLIQVGIGAAALAFAFGSISMSQQSDEKMKSLANLAAYEKVAMICSYMSAIESKETVNKDRIYYDLKAVVELRQWLDETQKKLLLDNVRQLRALVQRQGIDGSFIEKLKEIEEWLK